MELLNESPPGSNARVEAPDRARSSRGASEVPRSDGDAAIDDERPLDDDEFDDDEELDDSAGTPEGHGDVREPRGREEVYAWITATLNRRDDAAEQLYAKYWEGDFNSTYAHPARRDNTEESKIFGVPTPMLGRKENGEFKVKEANAAVPLADKRGGRDGLPSDRLQAADRIAHLRQGVQRRYADEDGIFLVQREDENVASAQKSLAKATTGADPAEIAKAERELETAQEKRPKAPVTAAEAKLAAAKDAQVGSVTGRIYAAEFDPPRAGADPQEVREAGEDAALWRKYTAEARVKQAELGLANAKHDYHEGKAQKAQAALEKAEESSPQAQRAGADLASARREQAEAATEVKQAESALYKANEADKDFTAKYASAIARAEHADEKSADTAEEVVRAGQALESARGKRAQAEQNLADAPPAGQAKAEESLREAEAELVVARRRETEALRANHPPEESGENEERPKVKDIGGANLDVRGEHALMRRDMGELLGHIAMEHRISDLNKNRPGNPFKQVEELPDRGARHLDMILEEDGESGRKYRVYEVKSPSSERGTANGYEQGHPQYLDDILQSIHDRARKRYEAIEDEEKSSGASDDLKAQKAEVKAEMDKAAELIEARRQDKGDNGDRVRYFQVRAEVEDSERGLKKQYKGYVENEFDRFV